MNEKVTDSDFYKTFGWISAIIIGLSIFIAILSNVFSSYSANQSDNYKKEIQELINSRTAPTGAVNLASNPTIVSQIQLTPVSSKILSGEEVYNVVCMSCHTSGVAGAPIIGNSQQWTERISEGKEYLYEQAINGVGVMPAKGGVPTLSDDEVKAAVDYIISKSN
jgi:cytochrome c5